MPLRRRQNAKRSLAPRRVRAKKSVSRSRLTVSKVKRMINRTQETKMASTDYGYTLFNSGITNVADLVGVLPSIARGTDEQNRIGSSIRPVKLVIRGYYNYNTYGNTNLDAMEILTRLFLLSDKTIKSYVDKASVSLDILDKGGLSQQFTGTTNDYLTPANTHRHRFWHDKRHVMMKPYGYWGSTTPLACLDKSMFKSFVITLYKKDMPAVLNYDENDSVSVPVNFAPFLALGYASAFGDAPDTTSTKLGLAFTSTLYYKDA